MSNDEVKTSWTITYIALTLLVSVLSGLIGYGLKFIFERPPEQVLQVGDSETENLLAVDKTIATELDGGFSLKGKPDALIKSYFRYTARIENASSIAVDDLKIIIESDQKDLILEGSPRITTRPKETIKGISINLEPKGDSEHRDEWVVSLLNPGEQIKFEYSAYSTAELDIADIACIPRKANWNIARSEDEDLASSNDKLLSKPISDLRGIDLFAIIVTGAVVFSSVPILIGMYFVLFSRLARRSEHFQEVVRYAGRFLLPLNFADDLFTEKHNKD